jgi:predicted nucleic acid-binding protein
MGRGRDTSAERVAVIMALGIGLAVTTASLIGWSIGVAMNRRVSARIRRASEERVRVLLVERTISEEYSRAHEDRTKFVQEAAGVELFDGIIAETAAKLKAIGDLERVEETQVAVSMGLHRYLPRPPMVPAIASRGGR